MIAALLQRLAARCEHFTIELRGNPYMTRHYLWPQTRNRDQDAHRTRFAIFLHQYHRPDAERWLHDHPWTWSIGIPLVGGYVEERLVGHEIPPRRRERRIRHFRPNLIRVRDFHRITSVQPGTWTLFIHGPRVKRWGFLVERDRALVWQLWNEYQEPGRTFTSARLP